MSISTSHRGISWCSERYSSQRHSPLCCKHLYKGQVQCLRGVMLVRSPVGRSNGASNQCYLFIAQWHTADMVAHGVIQASRDCVARDGFLSWINPDEWRPYWEPNVPLVSFSELSDELIIDMRWYLCGGGHQILLFYFCISSRCQAEFLVTWSFFQMLINPLKTESPTSREAKREAKRKMAQKSRWSSRI